MKASIGIDPGLTKTGITSFPDADETDILAWATLSCTDTKSPDLARVLSLADMIVTTTLRWVADFGILDLDIGIELPVLGRSRNPKTFGKQMRLVQEIESGIYYRVAPEVRECWVTEVYPNTSKVLACNYGQATKKDIITASPFYIYHGDWPLDRLEAVADAWAHGLSTWRGTKEPADRLSFTELLPARVGEDYGRHDDSGVA